MSQADFWYIRFPDGRILRAASTPILRQELSAGHIPLASTVRRSPSDEWVSLEWTQEFSELVEHLAAASRARPPVAPRRRNAEPVHPPPPFIPPPAEEAATVGSRLDATRLPRAGVRGHVVELLAALESTLLARKLILGLFAGLFLGALLALVRVAWFDGEPRWHTPAWSMVAADLLILALLTGLLTQLTYVELARLRPARWREGLAGLGALTPRLIVTCALVCGSAWGVIVLLRWLPHWLGDAGHEIGAACALVVGMVLEALLWLVFFFWWLLPPLLVVEEVSVVRALWQWYVLLRQHLSRVILYQTMAVGLGILVAAPFLVLIAPLFLPTFVPPVELREVTGATRAVLLGLAGAPFLTYWIVANVFLYLNLRYGASSER